MGSRPGHLEMVCGWTDHFGWCSLRRINVLFMSKKEAQYPSYNSMICGRCRGPCFNGEVIVYRRICFLSFSNASVKYAVIETWFIKGII